mmetsp:Transcript_31387/g.57630  ORF Transcript_31387/g.57630 Transcript_31387/m.57630 type:complete len:376 (-) Transcript_31387:101-1228(-)
MVGRVEREDVIEPLSLRGAWRSTIGQLHVYRDRQTPVFAFCLLLATWAAALARCVLVKARGPAGVGACLSPIVLYSPSQADWRSLALHLLWPLDRGYAGGVLTSFAHIILGYNLELQLGTLHFAGLFFGVHFLSSFLLLYYGFTTCHVSTEAILAGMAAIMHHHNPHIPADMLEKSMKVSFSIEPRWHLWVVLSLLLLIARDFSIALTLQIAGLLVAGAYLLREPEVWSFLRKSLVVRSPGVGIVLHVGLLFFNLTFVPLILTNASGLGNALAGGDVLRWSWWQTRSSPALFHLAMDNELSSEVRVICKLLIASALPLLLTPYRMWLRAYAFACVFLAMYTMVSPAWSYPHLGFVALFYLAWAFWGLPTMQTHQD